MLGGVVAVLVALPFKGESASSVSPPKEEAALPEDVPGGGAALQQGVARPRAGRPGRVRVKYTEKRPTRLIREPEVENARAPRTRIKPGAPVRTGVPLVRPARVRHPFEPKGGPRAATTGAIRLVRNTDLGSGTASLVSEPSVASNGAVVFETWNWYAAVSVNGGATFKFVNPRTSFPAAFGGFCCDQLALYVPGRDLFIWVLQYIEDSAGNNEIRVAVANGGAQAAAGNFRYWDLTPQQVGAPSGTNYDQPKVALTANNLFIEISEYGNRRGPDVLRLPLSTLAAGGTLTYSSFRPSVFSPALTAGAGSTMYFAGHVDNGTLRVYSWPDSVGPTGVSAVDVSHSTYPRPAQYHCRRAGGPVTSDWCSERNDDRIIYGWVSKGLIGFIWDAGQGAGGLGSFPYPYEHVVLLNEATKARVAEPALWNPNYAFQYASVAPNPAGNLGGIGLFGGGSTFENCAVLYHAAGAATFWDVTPVENSDSDTGSGDSGDYLTAHLDGSNPNLWSAACYALHGGGGDTSVHPYYVSFQPSGAAPPPPPPAPPPPPPGDRTAPVVRALVSTGKLGRKVKLRYTVSDDSGQSADTVRVFRGRLSVARLNVPLGPASSSYVYFVQWRAPRRRGTYRFCVQSRDPSGNVSTPSCAGIRLRR